MLLVYTRYLFGSHPPSLLHIREGWVADAESWQTSVVPIAASCKGTAVLPTRCFLVGTEATSMCSAITLPCVD